MKNNKKVRGVTPDYENSWGEVTPLTNNNTDHIIKKSDWDIVTT